MQSGIALYGSRMVIRWVGWDWSRQFQICIDRATFPPDCPGRSRRLVVREDWSFAKTGRSRRLVVREDCGPAILIEYGVGYYETNR
jgi:hypothetical protein